MTDSQRNMLILVALAVAGVLFSGAFSVGAGFASIFLNLAFTIVIVWALISFYQRNSGTIAGMPTTPRLVLQVGVIALIAMVATGLLHVPFLPFPFGWGSVYPMIFWPALLASGFAIWWSWQQRTSRW